MTDYDIPCVSTCIIRVSSCNIEIRLFAKREVCIQELRGLLQMFTQRKITNAGNWVLNKGENICSKGNYSGAYGKIDFKLPLFPLHKVLEPRMSKHVYISTPSLYATYPCTLVAMHEGVLNKIWQSTTLWESRSRSSTGIHCKPVTNSRNVHFLYPLTYTSWLFVHLEPT